MGVLMTDRPELVVLQVSPRVASHLVAALRLYRERQARDYLPFPPELQKLRLLCEGILTGDDSEGPEPPDLADVVPNSDAGPVSHLLDKKRVATALGISERQVDRISPDDLPRVRLGRSIRFDPSDLETYIEDRKETR